MPTKILNCFIDKCNIYMIEVEKNEWPQEVSKYYIGLHVKDNDLDQSDTIGEVMLIISNSLYVFFFILSFFLMKTLILSIIDRQHHYICILLIVIPVMATLRIVSHS